uniref:Protein kinase domain-containing protein n=1 Tax=Globisporangium ultimum (strain ATCC 200006 / CBS 805.95 / DAOM BR144) TaxID=431595 RepID=K3W6F3_GLOUD
SGKKQWQDPLPTINFKLKDADAGLELLNPAKSTSTNPLTVPVTPKWFIPQEYIELISENHGEWLGANVMLSTFQAPFADFESSATRWLHCRHPHVTKLFVACHLSSPRLLVTEYLPNGTLHEFLQTGKSQKSIWHKLHEAALGLQYLHRHKLAHGDLRSENIVMNSNSEAQITRVGRTSTCMGPGCQEYKASELLCLEEPSLASGVCAFGVCTLQFVVDYLPDGDRGYGKREWLTSKPHGMDDVHWCLITDMCKQDPKDRVKITYVAMQLKRFSNDEAQEHHEQHEMEGVDVATYLTPEIAQTVDKAVDILQKRYAKWSIMQRMPGDELARVSDLHSQLEQKGDKCP